MTETTTFEESLEGMFLEHLLENKVEISIYLVNGIRLKGVIRKFNNRVILLRNGNIQLIRLDAVSTIMPAAANEELLKKF